MIKNKLDTIEEGTCLRSPISLDLDQIPTPSVPEKEHENEKENELGIKSESERLTNDSERNRPRQKSKVDKFRQRCAMSTALAIAISSIASLVIAFKMPYKEEKIDDFLPQDHGHFDESTFSGDFMEPPPDVKEHNLFHAFENPSANPTDNLLSSIFETSAPLKAFTPAPTDIPTTVPSDLPSFYPTSVITAEKVKEDCETPTESEDQGYFYWHGAPLLEPGESLASEDEIGPRITIHVQFYEVCSAVNDTDRGIEEPSTSSGRVIDIWQANNGGYFDNAQYDLRGGYEASDDGKLTVRSVLPGRNGYGYLRHMHFKVWKNLSEFTGTYAEELTSIWYFGDDEEEMQSLESLYGGRLIRLDADNVGYATIYLDPDADVFKISSVSREWRRNGMGKDLFE
mmetsp:Transcript_3890/g.8683  ORF Transcript_3890/g.8683 Transcript_3890/m.8683 type:complete len:399 (-) Transcript_3890:125-1321(-)|eukprot:CAMPEP_0171343924 /NCGR_PEP_ID=MMETSP0878-20121228/18285_1 /TAXON_ID=67004 /ORGANISM="Thalassiosira weissflogii, Strain CCMP1336" /LENGTH=398 /DNA_ID=CAMNT_0011846981 /DNA_START=95 /DNA_END=1291 /DNA_ORIENTATION=-